MPKTDEKKKNERKKAILNSAFQVFSMKGYANTSVDDIVKHSGISKGGIYLYYQSKEELFFALAEERFQIRHVIIDWEEHEMDAVAQLKKYIKTSFANLAGEETKKGIRFTTEFWSISAQKPDIHQKSMIRYMQFYNDLSQILEFGISSRVFREDLDIRAITYLILSALDGISMVSAVMEIKMPPNTADCFINMILNDVLRK